MHAIRLLPTALAALSLFSATAALAPELRAMNLADVED